MNTDQILGAAIIFGSYGAMLALLHKSNSIIAEMKRKRIERKRKYAKKRIGHVLEVQRATRHRRR
ncbi:MULTISPECIES: hypothetical protein [Thermococcus]|jgi:hypothetical protein|uniref:Uncharacterized protein n=1 Tax=Thermococcus barossii TaxID=54077 RepID=A0A2Z2MGR4_9EURY|nr:MULTISPECIES: hypothetical protein [Thermococcus]ASJ04699.1 hypothetical protein A3L01_04720 [Thermococcus barossii]NJE76098.1 hypothetical protein [Thermococcus sp. ES12]